MSKELDRLIQEVKEELLEEKRSTIKKKAKMLLEDIERSKGEIESQQRLILRLEGLLVELNSGNYTFVSNTLYLNSELKR